MAAAALFIVPIIVPFFESSEDSSRFSAFFIVFLISPLLISALTGSIIGAGIFHSRRAGSGWRAVLRGATVAVTSYLVYAVVLSAWEGYDNHGGFSFEEAFTRTMMMMLIWGGIFFGWAVATVGAFAGLILHFVSLSLDKKNQDKMK